MSPARLTVLVSGGGTNLQALIDASRTGHLPDVQFVRVISDRKNAYGLTRAEAASIPTAHHGILAYKKAHPDDAENPQFSEARRAYDADLASLVLADRPDLVVCAGFMRILTPSFLNPLNDARVPIINLHPALHGDLVGAHCIERAWAEFEAGQRTKTGIMIHYVIAEVDMGEPIVQQEVSIEGCEKLQDLETRIHEAEHRLIVEGARKVLETIGSR
jgi:phosphoribosylglycinamide formyltransferase